MCYNRVMFGIITTSIIEKYHRIFDELNYHEEELATRDTFVKAAIKAINHTKDLDSAEDVICFIRDCLDNWGTIEKIFKTKLDIWKQYSWDGPQNIEYEKENSGVVYVTNAFCPKGKDFYIMSSDLEEDAYIEVIDEKNVLVAQIEPDPTYYIACSNRYPFDVDFYKYVSDRLVATLSSEDGRQLTENKLQIEINVSEDDDFISVYPKAYYRTVKEGGKLDSKKLLYAFEYSSIDNYTKYSIARIENYNDNDVELEAYLAIAFMVSGRRIYNYVKDHTNGSALSSFTTLAFLNHIRPH